MTLSHGATLVYHKTIVFIYLFMLKQSSRNTTTETTQNTLVTDIDRLDLESL